MEHYSVVIFLLAVAIGMSSLADKIKVPYPVLLLAAGIGVGFIPGFDFIPINPDVIFLIFLPPLLYDAAFNISFKEFKTNFRTISMMAITLVFITMIAIAVVAHYFIPGMTWPLAFVIGAILSPPDAAAAAGITKSLKLSHRTNTILEGESLINDASALIAYRVAVSVAIGGSFILENAVADFFISLAGGCMIGFILTHAALFIQRKLKFVDNAAISFNLLMPFVAYLFAEELNVSGVLAVVTMGLVSASQIHKKENISEETRIGFKSVWSTITYILSGLIFILIGLELPQVMMNIPSETLIPSIISAFMIFLIALIIRILVVFRHKFRLDKVISMVNDSNSFQSNDSRKRKRIEKMKALEPLNWKDTLIIGWSGMRGIVSLATALALPVVINNGESFPQRNTIIFLTVLVVIIMMLIQGLGLPLLIKWLKTDEDEENEEINR